MDHLERYRQLLSPALRDRLLQAIERQGFLEELKAGKARVVDAEPFAYVLLEVEADPRFVARGGGIYLDLSDLVDDPPPERFYFPYVGVTPNADEAHLAHELEHLIDLLDLISQEPSYVADALRLGMFNVEDPVQIPDSVRFEVRKIFLIEAPAFGRAYDRGEQVIQMPLFLGLRFPLRCQSREDFVGLWMADYLKKLHDGYIERFPDHAETIAAALEEATNDLGTAVFGPGAWGKASSLSNGLSERILAQLQDRSQT